MVGIAMTEADSDHTVIEHRDPMVGATLNERYRIDARIAAGGFGAIYRAHDLHARRDVALKVLHRVLTTDPSLVARFRREGKTLASLRDPHTVTAYELGETADGTLYIAMELLRGRTLHDLFHEHGGPLPWPRVIGIARAVCSSLAEAHDLGVVHRDLKPANIHIAAGDQVKVLDFGIAKILRGSDLDPSELTQTGQMIGTFDYMSPEQMLGGAIGGASDIYALGVVMYEMICGARPFVDDGSPTGLLTQLLTVSPPPLRTRALVPHALDRVIMRCLAREPQLRFMGVRELSAALDEVARSDAGEGPTLTRNRRTDEIVTAIAPPSAERPTIARAPQVRAEGSQPVIYHHHQSPMMPLLRPMPGVPLAGWQPLQVAPHGTPQSLPQVPAQLPPHILAYARVPSFDAARDATVGRVVWLLVAVALIVIAAVVARLL